MRKMAYYRIFPVRMLFDWNTIDWLIFIRKQNNINKIPCIFAVRDDAISI